MLNKGDTIGIIALSGECDKEKVLQSKDFFENMGFKVTLSKNIFSKRNYLAGKDEDKIEELHNFFIDPNIKLIICARGGYGAIRLINRIDYNLIKANPKLFCGFSDVTALLLMIYQKTGMITYHSPMACTDFWGKYRNNNFLSYSQEEFFKTINGKNRTFSGNKVYKSGQAGGILWGGNLSTVCSMCGLDFLPDKDFIFFTEEINEPVYKIDKMFQQLINIEAFRTKCKGIILGDFLETDNQIWLDEYFNELAERLPIPIIGGFQITHSNDKITLPIGEYAQINNLTLNF